MIVKDNFIIAIEPTDPQFSMLKEKINNKPDDPKDHAYMLRADNLEWELHELPPIPEPDPNIDNDELINILLGGETE